MMRRRVQGRDRHFAHRLQLNNADVQRAVMGALRDSPEFDDLLDAPELVRASHRSRAQDCSGTPTALTCPVGDMPGELASQTWSQLRFRVGPRKFVSRSSPTVLEFLSYLDHSQSACDPFLDPLPCGICAGAH